MRIGIPGVRALVADEYGDVEALRFDDVAGRSGRRRRRAPRECRRRAARGMLISTFFGPPDAGHSVSVRYIRMEQAMTTTAQVYELIARGELRIPIAASFDFAEASASLRQLSAGTSSEDRRHDPQRLRE
ncbi:hypothetical protein WPS_26350 [Vulcanimicrobium alpinum]|uniref:Uncharacterized protein n=1 Tax=Vulcanimicrobium alpinum TaxID=3016050 RepID=A0AAN1XYM1_UNVUL|nr:hypothetical protein [Vulcanimicrobium alpinum]BDE07359.1 hypothetical protein WPS_26350 [Vulcanimicrobium alpinum]